MMNPEKIELKSVSKKFQYGNISKRIENIDDVKVLREMVRTYVKMHFYHEEMMDDLMSKHRNISWSKR